MPRLTIADFNTARFFGYDGNMPGGYGKYQPEHFSVNPAYCQDATNEAWYVRAQTFIAKGGLAGRKIIDLGCAFGSLVRWLRQQGANAYGLDLSWPISQSQS
jgi:2-polyprenyl-3-methyl-5-hydroxy-6-metoxy-1,4-benzoquinol methylase